MAGRTYAPPVNGLHLQFGADASNEVVVTWQTHAPVDSPQVYLGTLERGPYHLPVPATTYGYVDPKEPDEPVYVHSARPVHIHELRRSGYADADGAHEPAVTRAPIRQRQP